MKRYYCKSRIVYYETPAWRKQLEDDTGVAVPTPDEWESCYWEGRLRPLESVVGTVLDKSHSPLDGFRLRLDFEQSGATVRSEIITLELKRLQAGEQTRFSLRLPTSIGNADRVSISLSEAWYLQVRQTDHPRPGTRIIQP